MTKSTFVMVFFKNSFPCLLGDICSRFLHALYFNRGQPKRKEIHSILKSRCAPSHHRNCTLHNARIVIPKWFQEISSLLPSLCYSNGSRLPHLNLLPRLDTWIHDSRLNFTDLMPATPLFNTGWPPERSFVTNFSTPTPLISIEPLSKWILILSFASTTIVTRIIGKWPVMIESPSSTIVIQFFISFFWLLLHCFAMRKISCFPLAGKSGASIPK